ncbi:MAG: mechanosensitive ion channel family protein [Bryobacterales bacterium]|nr:mechanosensitive ion channel family protein [Bryobacteraceae bacterium]MDW8129981.1 mechanosensitive ion channel family protein [Bryobacterales bacterium]
MFAPQWLRDEKLFWRVTEPILVFLTSLAAALLLRHLLLRRLHGGARPSSYAAVLLATIRLPSLLWCLAAAIAVSLQFVELSPRHARWASDAIVVFLIASFSLVAASIAVRSIAAYGERQGMPLAVAGLTRTMARLAVLATGLLILLAYLKISITPMLTALGIGGLAVALALQDTLANFFAGLHLLIERPIFVGDYIRLESGQEGVVTDIGWRTTRIRTLSDNMVVVPNTKITSGILLNYSLPQPSGAADMPILVAHEADAERVAAIAREEALRVDGVARDFTPLVFLDPGVLPTHLQLRLIVRIEDQTRRGRILSDIRWGLLKRFREEGIPLPRAELAALARDSTAG